MSAAVRDTVAKAIYDERARTGIGWMSWDQQTETVKELWRRCADAAVATMTTAQPTADELSSETRRLSHVIERDRTEVATIFGKIKKALGQYEWLRLGRGSYEYDDDRWKDEFGLAFDAVLAAAEPLRDIAANRADSPMTTREVNEARQYKPYRPHFVLHKKRGSSYRVDHIEAEVQSSRQLVEGDTVVVYVSAAGKAWVRPTDEFNDGRFELLRLKDGAE
jgi:hypothetical protein